MQLETEKSHHILSESWRLRKNSGINQSETEGLRTKRNNGVGLGKGRGWIGGALV